MASASIPAPTSQMPKTALPPAKVLPQSPIEYQTELAILEMQIKITRIKGGEDIGATLAEMQKKLDERMEVERLSWHPHTGALIRKPDDLPTVGN